MIKYTKKTGKDANGDDTSYEEVSMNKNTFHIIVITIIIVGIVIWLL